MATAFPPADAGRSSPDTDRRPSPVQYGAIALATAALLAHWALGVVHVSRVAFEPSPRLTAPAAVFAPVSAPASAPATAPAAGAAAAVVYREGFAPDGGTAQVHATSAYPHAAGGLTAFWYGGTREGHGDVAIYTAQLGEGGQWQPARQLFDRASVAKGLGRPVRKLGNATIHKHADGRVWMFFVTVSVGGWAGSSLNLVESIDNGQSWGKPRRLVTSPFFNLSTLGRADPIRYVDGSIGLPVYHEFIGKFAELIRIAPDGRVLRKTRLSTGREALQPEIITVDADEAFGLLRYAGPPPRRLLQVRTTDGGRTWSEPEPVALANPNAAFDIMYLGNHELLAVVNDTEEHRNRLTLAHSADLGRNWQPLSAFDASDKHDEFSYPWLTRTADGQFHVFYTWNRTRIKHVEFSATWLAEKRQPADAGKQQKP